MESKVTARLRLRKDYSKFEKPHKIPNLIDVQWRSYESFLQTQSLLMTVENRGLQAVFKSVFPIRDYNGSASLEFVSYSLGEPKYDVMECHERGMTWAAPLRVTVQLVLWDTSDDGTKNIRDIKEQEVYFGEIPLMTQHGTFMVNGTERVVVSQLHRSPGVFFGHDAGKTHSSGKLLYNARVIPYRGSWLDFEFDIKDVLHCRIDRRRKQPATILLRALGLGTEEIVQGFYRHDQISIDTAGAVKKKVVVGQLEGQKVFKDIKSGKKGEKPLAKAGQKFNRAILRRMKEANIEEIEIDPLSVSEMVSSKTIVVAAEDVAHPKTNKTLVKKGKCLVGWDKILKAIPEEHKDLGEEALEELFLSSRSLLLLVNVSCLMPSTLKAR